MIEKGKLIYTLERLLLNFANNLKVTGSILVVDGYCPAAEIMSFLSYLPLV